MIKMFIVFAFFLILFFFCKEIYNTFIKAHASGELEDVQKREDLFEIERETLERERKLEKKKEALYSRDEVTDNHNQDA